MQFDQVRDRLVLAALPSVCFDGWTMAVLGQAAAQEGFDATMAERAFLDGPIQAVEHFTAMADRLMVEDGAALDLSAMRVPDRIFHLLVLRLQRWAAYREAVRKGLSLLVLPQNAAKAAALNWQTAHVLWQAVGDASHDFSWYSRRFTLSALYAASLLYWLEDGSEECADTQAFIKRRLKDLGRFHQAKGRVQGGFKGLVPAFLRPAR